MSFEKIAMNELLYLAKEWGLDLKFGMKKSAVIALFEEEGITYEAVTAVKDIVEDEPVNVIEEPSPDSDEKVLVKMSRANPYFEFRNFVFKNTKPFCIMPTSEAQALIDLYEGFHLASPKEAKSFYS
jgi:hypothetical protein